jgi:hypothetical protein
MRWMHIFNVPNLSSRTRPRSSLRLLTEMSARSRNIMFLGSRAHPVRRADNLTAICEPNVGSLTSHNSTKPPRPVTEDSFTSVGIFRIDIETS